MSEKQLTAEIKRVEKEMLVSARNLDSKKPRKRDRLMLLKERLFVNPE